MELILIRHLQTRWNLERRLQGSQDISILEPSEAHLECIEKNKAILKRHEPFDAVMVSSLQRTKQTAKQYGYEYPKIEELLDELNFGEYEGRKKESIWTNPEWKRNPRSMKLGESLIDFENRLITFLAEFQNLGKILIFGHGSWIRAMMSLVNYGDINAMNSFKVKNNDLVQLKLSDELIKSLVESRSNRSKT
jgi:broad specificity phosphatase PhoE